ncbi:LysM domain-containing protein [Streptococcus ferus]|uniref:LysM domain-containing protein n=2 Tax=Streptococcus ferus TaxID=1345 RepID=A0A2X3W5G5_9STRE|nr:LysM domain-containing protein [Streptococcus ferus]
MKMNKKTLLASTVVLSAFSATALDAQAQELPVEWTARTVEEIKTEVVNQGGSVTYTIKYGDTLSSIAEAMGVDLHVLAAINQIANVDLIYPDTVLNLTFDGQNNIVGVEIQSPTADNGATETVAASVDVANNQASVNDQTVSISETTQAAPETSTVAAEPVTEATTEATTASTETTAAETVQSEAVAAVPETTQAETSTSETTTTAALDTTSQTETSAVSEAEIPAETTQAQTEAAPVVTEAETTAAVTEAAPQAQAVAATTSTSSTDSSGLQPQVSAFKDEVAGIYGITSFSTYRAGDSGDHGKGLAVDFMVPDSSALGDQVAQYAISNMGAKNISYVIWKQRFYAPFDSIYGPAYTWNPMPDRGSATANHYDHVHVSFNG